ncbi:glutamate--cysteine ligase [Malonomonas rubra DSM 5091]|uniref:Glutamate--cysteine ligase n=1 Tax=Malonomonas rubra DSM 5091 TaxID=1122189 RepID=A0A1M6L9Q6_MALRU|nr:glutamate-cysteine ligase family protein [Malonomonas rubra]SHJ67940.1 glutamate--cysteine ligase [Malonomonas rubra DSM 5091]
MLPFASDKHAQLIDAPQQLKEFLLRGARPRKDWGVGLESEKLVVDRQTGEVASYERIRDLLARLEGVGGWEGSYEGEHLLGLQGKRSSITLEPGGQLELSGRFCCDIHCSWRDLSRYRQLVMETGRELDLMFLGLGVQPFTPLEKIDWLPKARYDVMGPYMLKAGSMGQRMMKQTAGTQVNLDYSDEADCLRKLRAVQWLAPVCYALFANSPVMEDNPTGFLSTRGHIWSHTDADRCGLILQLFAPDAGFDSYIEYALNVPMYFIQRDNRYINLTNQRLTFGHYLETGWQECKATLADWDLHLSTLFPEVRLRPQIEIRSADSLPPAYTASVAAFYKGLLYCDDALTRIESLFNCLSEEDFLQLYRDSWKLGLKATSSQGSLQEIAAELLPLASTSLRRQFEAGCTGADESSFLYPLKELVESGETLAEQLLARWRGSREEKLKVLFDRCDFSHR